MRASRRQVLPRFLWQPLVRNAARRRVVRQTRAAAAATMHRDGRARRRRLLLRRRRVRRVRRFRPRRGFCLRVARGVLLAMARRRSFHGVPPSLSFCCAVVSRVGRLRASRRQVLPRLLWQPLVRNAGESRRRGAGRGASRIVSRARVRNDDGLAQPKVGSRRRAHCSAAARALVFARPAAGARTHFLLLRLRTRKQQT